MIQTNRKVFNTWEEAQENALERVRRMRIPHAVRKAKEYNKIVFIVEMRPRRDKRFGSDLQGEIYEVEDWA